MPPVAVTLLPSRPIPAFAALAAFVLLACARDTSLDTAGTAAVRRDSGGIEVVSNVFAASHAPPWEVDAAPAVSIGQREGPAEYLLDTLAGALRLSDGRILVLERAARFRYYDSAGVHDTTFSRRGDGPGEVRRIRTFWRYRGDSIVFFTDGGGSSNRSGRSAWGTATVLTANGETGTERLLRLSFPPGREFAFSPDLGIETTTADGGFLLRHSTAPVLEGRPGKRWAMEPYAILAPDGSRLDTVTILPTVDLDELTEGKSVVPFFRRRPIPVVTSGSWMYWGNGDTFEVRVFDLSKLGSGLLQPTRVIRYARPNPPVKAATRERYLAYMLQRAESSGDTAAYREAHRTRPWRPTIPAFQRMLVDSQGNLWAEHVRIAAFASVEDDGSEPHVWSVFDSTGAIVGDVRTPDRLRIQQIGDRWILGIWADADNVEYVRLHRINKRGE